MNGYPVPLEIVETRVVAFAAITRTSEVCGIRHAAMLPPANSYFGAVWRKQFSDCICSQNECNCIQNNVIIFIMYASRARTIRKSCISAHNGIHGGCGKVWVIRYLHAMGVTNVTCACA